MSDAESRLTCSERDAHKAGWGRRKHYWSQKRTDGAQHKETWPMKEGEGTFQGVELR